MLLNPIRLSILAMRNKLIYVNSRKRRALDKYELERQIGFVYVLGIRAGYLELKLKRK